jgi:hypothetical protein
MICKMRLTRALVMTPGAYLMNQSRFCDSRWNLEIPARHILALFWRSARFLEATLWAGRGHRRPARTFAYCRLKRFWPSFPWSAPGEAGFPNLSRRRAPSHLRRSGPQFLRPAFLPVRSASVNNGYGPGRLCGSRAGAPAA